MKEHHKSLGIALTTYRYHRTRTILQWFSSTPMLKVYATLTMGNRFLGVQISIIWVVFAFKTITLLWLPAQERITEGHLLGIMRKRWKYTTQSDVIIPHWPIPNNSASTVGQHSLWTRYMHLTQSRAHVGSWCWTSGQKQCQSMVFTMPCCALLIPFTGRQRAKWITLLLAHKSYPFTIVLSPFIT